MKEKTTLKYWVYMREGDLSSWQTAGSGSMYVSTEEEAKELLTHSKEVWKDMTQWKVVKDTIHKTTEELTHLT